MPGVDTHYFFGLDTLDIIDDNYVKKCCQIYPGSFSYGLQGPDIFFFFTFVHLANKKNLGTIIHTQKVNQFLHNMLRQVMHFPREEERQIAISYFAGFLGHYVLDSNVHPFVYGRTKYDENDPKYHSRHVFLETDINTLMLEKFTGMKPSEFRQGKTVLIPWHENKVVRRVLLYAISKTFPDYVHFPVLMPYAMYLMAFCTHSLVDNSWGHKKYLFRKLESIFAKRPLLSPLIGSDRFKLTGDPLNLKHEEWTNPWDENLKSTESFYDLFNKAQMEYMNLLNELNAYLEKKTRKNFKKFISSLGNRSYHSGIEL